MTTGWHSTQQLNPDRDPDHDWDPDWDPGQKWDPNPYPDQEWDPDQNRDPDWDPDRDPDHPSGMAKSQWDFTIPLGSRSIPVGSQWDPSLLFTGVVHLKSKI